MNHCGILILACHQGQEGENNAQPNRNHCNRCKNSTNRIEIYRTVIQSIIVLSTHINWFGFVLRLIRTMLINDKPCST